MMSSYPIRIAILLATLGGSACASVGLREPLGPATRRSGLVFSEIMHHPSAQKDGRDLEFLELYNAQDTAEELTGYHLSGAIDFAFPDGVVLQPGAFLVVARVPRDIEAAYDIKNVMGGYTGTLQQVSGTVRLRHRTGAILSEGSYSTLPPWPVAADGAGHSAVLIRPSFGANDIRAWGPGARMGGSPGQGEPDGADQRESVVIDEILAQPAPGQDGFVELFNYGSESVDLAGAWLTDNPSNFKFEIPIGTSLPPGGHVAFSFPQLGFSLGASGGTVYLANSSRNAIIDAVRFGAQVEGNSWGRSPEAASSFRELAAPTPGAPNRERLARSIVINEIMYRPISGSAEDQFIELFNRGASSVDLGGWKFVDGVEFTFPVGTTLASGEYLVVAKNAVRLLTNYPGLDRTRTVGDFTGTLSGSGERLALAMPDPSFHSDPGAASATPPYVVVNEVTYAVGGSWGEWSNGGGSSLELMDPYSNNELAANWADSDETRKAPWTTVETTGVLDLGTGSADQLQMFLQGAGDCVVDNVQVLSDGQNLVPNSTFENDAASWVAEGTQETSGLAEEGYQSGHSFRVRAVARGDNEVNRIRTRLVAALRPGQTATIRANVRWLRGFPSMLFRLRGNYLEAIAQMALPSNLGTPGARNSRALTNLGPAVDEVRHEPILPEAGESVVVTARVEDPDGIASVQLVYRVDPASEGSSVTMRDDGANGDRMAGDGIYSASIPGQPQGVLIAFHIEATDGATLAASSRFPAGSADREGLIRFGEVQPAGTFATYRLWMTQATFNRWSTRHKLSNTPLDVTFVYNGDRAIYGAQALYAGSPYISPGYSTPAGALCGYTVRFPEDEPVLGAPDVVLDWPGRDNTALEEQLTYWIAEQLDLTYNYRRFVHLHVNGVNEQQRGSIYEDVQQPGGDILQEWVPSDPNGDFYKIERWFEFSDGGQLLSDPQPTLENFTTTGGLKKLARYRWNWLKRATRDVNNYTNVFDLVDAVNAPAPEPYTAWTESLVDTEQWMRIFAVEHIVDNFDSYGHFIGKNMYAYKPDSGKWLLFMFDIDWVMKESAAYGHGQTPTAPLFDVNDPVIARMYQHPPFRRAYFRAVQDAVNGPLRADRINPLMDAKYAALLANGVSKSAGRSLAPPTAVKQWIADRRNFLGQQLASVAADFAITSPSLDFGTGSSPVVLTGTAPIDVRSIRVNGREYPVTWTGVTSWSLAYPLRPGLNTVQLEGLDTRGRPLAQAKATANVNFSGPDPLAGLSLKINEWMAANTNAVAEPSTGRFEDWFELFNGGSASVDLTGFTLTDNLTNTTKFVIPAGTTIPAHGFLLVWADERSSQGSPTNLHVNFKLAQGGEEIGLFAPNGQLVDSIVFGPQRDDISQGRSPDGSDTIQFLARPTPGAPNQGSDPGGEVRITGVERASNGGLRITWASQPGRTYRVQTSSQLAQPNWANFGELVTATEATTSVTLAPVTEAMALFYRLVAL